MTDMNLDETSVTTLWQRAKSLYLKPQPICVLAFSVGAGAFAAGTFGAVTGLAAGAAYVAAKALAAALPPTQTDSFSHLFDVGGGAVAALAIAAVVLPDSNAMAALGITAGAVLGDLWHWCTRESLRDVFDNPTTPEKGPQNSVPSNNHMDI